MGRLLIKIIGLSLLLVGIYFFAQNIIFVSSYYSFYQRFPATLSGLAIILGIFLLLFFRRETGNVGYFLLAIGLVLVFFNGRVFFKPTSLWNLLVALGALISGYQLLNTGKVRF
ncbi:hypothetical protein [Nodularia sphaerocarpa]|uniref:hypothetical protein n=1 Tax=Nodularia sphaerocarpa TaxID=137816 RepID=UPI001EFB9E7E|nr:hypothetical protein [Nodularia sphaerocarpa]MDB9375139.1 hypothetical protein [Nodularia sphaerocarpa CS-585]MDB9380150.1 hypothetical protein [Nodularia sphaerocarpa CS-585A2]ULP73522.1 hypothetical protein BDGGKGIB_03176 [Nodularia sphaerocarpa UHCC 0038]